MFNSQFNRPDGGFNNVVRLHYITPTLDREATVMMPFDATTVQNDGNLSGNATSPWIIRYGKYLVVLNNTSASYAATLPAGLGTATLIQAHTSAPLGTTQPVPANSYEVFVLPQ